MAERDGKQYTGGAKKTFLTTPVNASAETLVVADGSTFPDPVPILAPALGDPVPASSLPFVVTIARGTASEEKVLIESRVGSTLTVEAGGRGYDGTAAASHSEMATVEHTIDAFSFSKFMEHTNDPALTDAHFIPQINGLQDKVNLLDTHLDVANSNAHAQSNITGLPARMTELTGVKNAQDAHLNPSTLDAHAQSNIDGLDTRLASIESVASVLAIQVPLWSGKSSYNATETSVAAADSFTNIGTLVTLTMPASANALAVTFNFRYHIDSSVEARLVLGRAVVTQGATETAGPAAAYGRNVPPNFTQTVAGINVFTGLTGGVSTTVQVQASVSGDTALFERVGIVAIPWKA